MILTLEIARGLAALWVFFFHVRPLFETSSPVIHHLSSFGDLGVPMFFVISGYVITHSAESSLKNERSPVVFLKARFLRIYPTFWVSVAIVLITPYVVELISFFKSGEYLLPENLLEKYNYIEWSNFLLLTKVFLSTSHDLQAEFNAINSVYWTLAIEFQFYLVVFFALCSKFYYKYVISTVSLLALLLMLVPIEINHGLFIHYWPSFLVGIVLAYMHRKGVWSNRIFENRVTHLAILLVVMGIFVLSIAWYDENKFLFAVSFGTLLWVVSDIEVGINRVKNGKNKIYFWLLEPWFVLGAMSYSVYLLHGKIYVLPNMFVRQFVDSSNILYGLLTIFCTLVLCYPFFLLVERKFLSKNYRKIKKKAVAGVN